MARHTAVDKSILEAALIGLEQQKTEIDDKLAEIRRRLRGLPGTAKAEGESSGGRAKRVLSPAARRRIAAATRKRWAAYRAAKAASQAPAKKAAGKRGGARKKGASTGEPAAGA